MEKILEAISIFEKCAELRLEVLGETHLDYISTLSNLGSMYFFVKRYKNAIGNYSKCCEFYEKSPENKKDYVVSLNNLAMAYLRVGQYE